MTATPAPAGTPVNWAEGTWTTTPAHDRLEGTDLCVTAVSGSDAWRITSYGFIHDTEHALLAPLAVGEAMEVTFLATFTEQFDQAGLFFKISATEWIKAGVEFADGVLGLGAVVTHGSSDWSIGAVPEWNSRPITIRLSRDTASVTVRARVEDEPFRLVRVAWTPEHAIAAAGPMLCAPTRAGLEIRFQRWSRGAADAALH